MARSRGTKPLQPQTGETPEIPVRPRGQRESGETPEVNVKPGKPGETRGETPEVTIRRPKTK